MRESARPGRVSLCGSTKRLVAATPNLGHAERNRVVRRVTDLYATLTHVDHPRP